MTTVPSSLSASSSVVMVRIRGPDLHKLRHQGHPCFEYTSGFTTLPGSGFVVDEQKRLIITSGTFIKPFRKFRAISSTTLAKTTIIEVLFDGTSDWVPVDLFDTRELASVNDAADSLIRSGGADVRIGWHVPSHPGDLSAGSVALLQCRTALPVTAKALPFRSCQDVVRGEPVVVIASPYGLMSRANFQNTVTHGVVANAIRNSAGQLPLLMTDARCLPGAEGGVVLDRYQRVLGLVGPPLRYPNGSLVDLQLIVSSDVLQTMVRAAPAPAAVVAVADLGQTPEAVTDALRSLVRVALPAVQKWASGIALGNGIVLTNAHLFRPYLSQPVETFSASDPLPTLDSSNTIYLTLEGQTPRSAQPQQRFVAELIYVSPSPLDAALVRVIDQAAFAPVPMSLCQPSMSLGQRIFVAGYPLFGLQIPATVTAGCLAKISLFRDQAVMLQTTAAVNQGNSGGMLLASNGQLLGMVTFNTVSTTNEVVPKLNFALPVRMFQSLADFVFNGATDRSILEEATITVEGVRRILRLRTEPLLPPPGRNSSKFHEFIQRMGTDQMPIRPAPVQDETVLQLSVHEQQDMLRQIRQANMRAQRERRDQAAKTSAEQQASAEPALDDGRKPAAPLLSSANYPPSSKHRPVPHRNALAFPNQPGRPRL
eukprot:TRINITY_DN9519_c0_g1_i1.p1 TRINITY_DN9519_c0_g1~~TRINITY_DN9519_c0_g1_i1.p1  ORF type:complete len:675 (-),score=87.79 TRINITY_DN9519_c0_g1_i1:169-2127(-)